MNNKIIPKKKIKKQIKIALMSDLEIKIINTKHSLYSAEQQLRNNVLLIPYGLPPHFWEMNDKSSFHIVTIDKENNVVGCLLLYPLPNELDSVQLMQMAVSKGYYYYFFCKF